MTRVFHSSLAVFLLCCLSLPSQARQNDLAQSWQMKPMLGHASALEAALSTHAKWRMEHNDPWGWTVMEVITGPNVGTFVARSGGHTWADFDTYMTWEQGAAAEEHFNKTVTPHLAELSTSITAGDEENVHWPEDPSTVRFITIAGLDLKPGGGEAIGKVVSAYHKVIVDHNRDDYHYIAWGVSGSEYDMYLAFPGSSMADFAQSDAPIDELMKEVHGGEAFMKMQESWNNAVEEGHSWMVAVRPDLSVTAADM